MKSQFYWLFLFASFTIIGIVLLRPSLIDQCCSLLGWERGKFVEKEFSEQSFFEEESCAPNFSETEAEACPFDGCQRESSDSTYGKFEARPRKMRPDEFRSDEANHYHNLGQTANPPKNLLNDYQYTDLSAPVSSPLESPSAETVPDFSQFSQQLTTEAGESVPFDHAAERPFQAIAAQEPLTVLQDEFADPAGPATAAAPAALPPLPIPSDFAAGTVSQVGYVNQSAQPLVERPHFESHEITLYEPENIPQANVDDLPNHTEMFDPFQQPLATLPQPNFERQSDFAQQSDFNRQPGFDQRPGFSQQSDFGQPSPPAQAFRETIMPPNTDFRDAASPSVFPPSPGSFETSEIPAQGSRVDSRFQVDPGIVEVLPCPGAETIARVGTEVILGCDILPEAKKIAYINVRDQLQKMPPEVQANYSEKDIQAQKNAIVAEVLPFLLEQQIKSTLLYCDFTMGKKREEIKEMERRVGDSFDDKMYPNLLKQFNVRTRSELNEVLEKETGSSLDREKASFIRKFIAESWMFNCIGQAANGECTYEEMLRYYNDHLSDFEHKPRARWEQLTVRFSPKMPKEEARKKIAWMGDQVLQGAPFEEIAKHNSDGPTAAKGGDWPWTAEGSLASSVLEKEVFSAPVGKLGPILEDQTGLHIIRILEREDRTYTPFLETQASIREKIREQRRNKKEADFISELYRRYQPEKYTDVVQSLVRQETKVVLPQENGTSLHKR